MNSSLPSFLFVSLLLLLIVSPIASVVALLRKPSNLPSISAETLIRELNLFPNKPVNIVDGDVSSSDAPRIVERQLTFPNLFDSTGVSVEELGHHAGYYKIQHSHGARFISLNIGLNRLFSLHYC